MWLTSPGNPATGQLWLDITSVKPLSPSQLLLVHVIQTFLGHRPFHICLVVTFG